MSPDALVMIKIDRYFAGGQGLGVRYDDQDLNIDWRIPKMSRILSFADQELPNFNEILTPFDYNIKLY